MTTPPQTVAPRTDAPSFIEEIEGKPAAAPPPAAAAGTNAPTGPGKTIDWNQMFFSVGAQPYTRPGVTSTWTCPPAPAGKPLPKVLGGTNDHHGHSSRLCAAAVHAGKITTDKSGTFTIVVEEASAKYVGTTANGIAGEDGNKFSGGGFGFELPAAPMAVRWSEDKWRNVFEVYPTAGETKTFSCAAATDQDKKRPGDVIGGSDEYTEWSSLCWAAVHEGDEKGSTEYKGSTANGVTSKDGKSSDRFSFGFK